MLKRPALNAKRKANAVKITGVACAKVCPTQAIKGEKKQSHLILAEICSKCGSCIDVCKTNAIIYKDADLQFVLACAAKACVQDKNVIYFTNYFPFSTL
jgi:Na+-translocating ferredoxin:NAD+ oxidoreductase RNF subunit RnfB